MSRGMEPLREMPCQVSAQSLHSRVPGQERVGLTASMPESCMPAFSTATESVCQRSERSRSSCHTDAISMEESDRCSSCISSITSWTSGLPRNRCRAVGRAGHGHVSPAQGGCSQVWHQIGAWLYPGPTSPAASLWRSASIGNGEKPHTAVPGTMEMLWHNQVQQKG